MAHVLPLLETPKCPTPRIDTEIDQWNKLRNKYAYAMEVSADQDNVVSFIVASQVLKFLNHLNSVEERNISAHIDNIVQQDFVLLTRPAPEPTQTQWLIDRKVSYYRLAIINQLYDYKGKEWLERYIY